ncbi:MAG TPA: hypothetical protein PLC97_10125, partial [Myxococcota bacterium]|nr:hypothetical protein [Myxococcota bacterium]
NCNEEIKRQKEQTIRSQNMLVSRICSRIRARARIRARGRPGGEFWSMLEPRQNTAKMLKDRGLGAGLK